MDRVDLHIHIGDVPAGRRSVTKNSMEGVVNYITSSQLTHAVILYTNYDDVEELHRRLPDLKIYALQWIDVTNLKKVKLDIDKPLFRGLKLHTERNSANKEKDTIYYSLKNLNKVLDKLPDESIVLGHFQGSPTSNPMSFTRLAMKYPRLKFIIGHSGCFGLRCFPPTRTKTFFEEKFKQEFMSLYINGLISINNAIMVANNTQNMFLDSSTYVKFKSILFDLTDKIGFGSDYPFKPALNQNLQFQEHMWMIHMKRKDLTIEQVHKRTIEFLDSTLEERVQKYFEENKVDF